MSYNIDSVKCLILDAQMKASDILNSYFDYEEHLPESNFLDHYFDRAEELVDLDRDEMINIDNFYWSGSGAGSRSLNLLKKIAPLIVGKVHAVLIWEGGDSITGFKIEDGKFIECKVSMALVQHV